VVWILGSGLGLGIKVRDMVRDWYGVRHCIRIRNKVRNMDRAG